MMFTVGHLVVICDGVEDAGSWRGKWTIHRPRGIGSETGGELIYVDDGTTTELHGTREEAAVAAESIARSHAEMLYNER
nr:hypothetical protein [Dyella sp. ASV24]